MFSGIPLDQITVSMTMNGAVLPIIALYIVAAEEQGIKPDQLTGTIQNDILKEIMAAEYHIYIRPRLPCASFLIFSLSRLKRCRNLIAISISGYHMQEAGATRIWNWHIPSRTASDTSTDRLESRSLRIY